MVGDCTINRYHRQTLVKTLGDSGQEKLGKAHIGIVGVGGLGCPVSTYLAGAGIGKLTLIDHDSVSLTNLHRQVLFTESDIGKPKAKIAKNTLNDLNRESKIVAVTEALNAANIKRLLVQADVIVDAADNFAISYLLSDFSRKHHKPLVSASVMQTYGYVGVYGFSTYAQMACPSLRAVFPHPPAVGQDCNSVGVMGTAAGMLGILQAQEVIKVILGDASQLAGRLLNVDCWTYRQSIMDFNQAPEPEHWVKIIAASDITPSDWVIDVRSEDEAQKQPQPCSQQTPGEALAINRLPHDKRLVFTCAAGQRALFFADKALQAGHHDVAVRL